MVNYFVGSAQGRVFVFDDIKAVWAGGNDLRYAIAIQRLDIVIGHHLEKELIARTACRVSCTHFLLAQYGKFYSNLVEYLCKSFGDPLRPLVEAAGAPYPKQYLGSFTISYILGHRFYMHDSEFS